MAHKHAKKPDPQIRRVARAIRQAAYPSSALGEWPSEEELMDEFARRTHREFQELSDRIDRGLLSHNLASFAFNVGYHHALIDNYKRLKKSEQRKFRRHVKAMLEGKMDLGRDSLRDVKPRGRIIPDDVKRKAVRRFEDLVRQGKKQDLAARIVDQEYGVSKSTLNRARKSFSTL